MSINQKQLIAIRDQMTQACLLAGKYQQFKFKGDFVVEQKAGHQDLVTEVDKECQEIILNYLLKNLDKMNIKKEEFGLIGEEEGEDKIAKYTFTIDPIDGTTNFAIGFDMFGPMISLIIDKEVVIGVVYNPIKDKLITAIKGLGAYCNGRRIELKKENTILETSEMILQTKPNAHGKLNPKYIPQFRGTREITSTNGTVELMLEGAVDVKICRFQKIWDFLPAKAVLNEVGIEFYSWDGSVMKPDLNNLKKAYPGFACHYKNRDLILSMAD